VGFLLGLRGSAKVFEKILQKNVDGFFVPDIMRPLLLLQQEVWGGKGCKLSLKYRLTQQF
jgi:hypothetical protein